MLKTRGTATCQHPASNFGCGYSLATKVFTMDGFLRSAAVITIAVGAGCLTGCKSPYHRDQLATFGGLAGAGVGAALSNGNGNELENAAIGAAVGSLTGAVVGNQMDETEARNRAYIHQAMGRELSGATTIADVVSMSQAGLSDEVIRTHIGYHGLARTLATEDLITLKQQGVSDGVIQAMQAPATVAPVPVGGRPVIVEEHIYPGCVAPYPRHRYHYHHRPHGHRRPHHAVSWGVSFGN